MKTTRHLIATYLALGLCLAMQGTNALADETRRSGTIVEINSDYSGAMVDKNYFQLDRRTVVHAPMGNSYLSVDTLTAGTRIGFRTDQPANANMAPKITEIWIQLD